MNKIISDERYKVYYTDTDSLVIKGKLPKELVSSKEIGKFKLEHKVEEGVFIVPKVYGLKCEKGKYVCKVKGVKSNVVYEDLREWVQKRRKKVFKETRIYRDLVKGLKEKEVELHLTSEMKGRRMSRGYTTRPININKMEQESREGRGRRRTLAGETGNRGLGRTRAKRKKKVRPLRYSRA